MSIKDPIGFAASTFFSKISQHFATLAENRFVGTSTNQEYADELYRNTLDEGLISWKRGKLKDGEFKDFLDTMLTAVTAAWRREIMESNMQTRTFL